MKTVYKRFKRTVCLILAVSVLACLLCSCGVKQTTLMTLGEETLSVEHYRLLLSRMRAVLADNGLDSASFFRTYISVDGKNVTYDEYYRGLILENAESFLVAKYLFTARGLSVSSEEEVKIDRSIADLITSEAGGSETQFSKRLKEYFGLDKAALREIYMDEAKIEAVKADLYGENGELISAGIRDSYAAEHYVHFKQVLFKTYGESEDGETVDFDETKKAQVREDAEAALANLTAGDVEAFEKLVSSMTESESYYADGYYIRADKTFSGQLAYVGNIVKAIADAEVGAYALVESEYGYHIVMKYDVPSGAYSESVNAEFFDGMLEDIMDEMFLEECDKYRSRITVDTSVLEGITLEDCVANYSY